MHMIWPLRGSNKNKNEPTWKVEYVNIWNFEKPKHNLSN